MKKAGEDPEQKELLSLQQQPDHQPEGHNAKVAVFWGVLEGKSCCMLDFLGSDASCRDRSSSNIINNNAVDFLAQKMLLDSVSCMA